MACRPWGRQACLHGEQANRLVALSCITWEHDVSPNKIPFPDRLLAARGISRETEGKSAEEMDAKLKELLP